MIIIGVTGGFATGKTTVANFFAELGAKVIDADKIAHNIIRRNSPVFREIVASFGKDILSKPRPFYIGRNKKQKGWGKSIDRKKLASLVFSDKKSLRKLCQITHPCIITTIKKRLSQIEKANPQSVVVIDAPLLIETNLNKIVDWLLVVDTTPRHQLQRAITKTGISQCEVNKRIKAQLPLANKKKLADCVIDNNGTLVKTKKQVKRVWEEITKL